MKTYYNWVWAFFTIMLLTGCTASRRFGTTIERDEKNPCVVNIIIQIAIEGTDADVTNVRNDLDACFSKECFLPCPDSTKGCKTKATIKVVKFSTLSPDEQSAYHYVQMIDNDGLPSNAYLGKPNAGASSGTWRRNEPSRTYCHEVLHLCGLDDQYCSRLYDPVTNTVINQRNCIPPPDPNGGNCCTPHALHTRCSNPCAGHEHNLMATLNPELSCDNIKDVLKQAAMQDCPIECCQTDSTFTRPGSDAYLLPGYLNFGDKNNRFGAIGITGGYTYKLNTQLGLTIEGSSYLKSEKSGEYKYTDRISNIVGGVSYYPFNDAEKTSKLSVSTQALAGIAFFTQKSSGMGNTNKITQSSFTFQLGAALDYQLNKNWGVRAIQARYTPTFFFNSMQQSFTLHAGLLYHFDHKNCLNKRSSRLIDSD